ncbi:MAG TPA: UDP-N-acetylmuramoyl-L-alanyl-D-glutamate--2,6-diaminopimelate ligase [Bacillota bacterium]|nr:UDP-N-acetylmuramoyl-L-alanyl-D-glutamate--2,6-diaminopimelate ligase [Bacillota bacterium]HPT87192.1 UDP-N-acetylmuramoyl-L-alanyl-D-glutamate--2,6-diaminopimelate ligase [Bacillota bacterium]
MRLSELIDAVATLQVIGSTEREITGLSQDSRKVRAGDLFFCIRGVQADGHRYLKDAVAAGCVAAVVEYIPDDVPEGITLIQVQNVSSALKAIAGKFYDYPDGKLKIIGVIGTNGKTTSTFLMKSILEAAGHRVGLIGTIINLVGDEEITINDGSVHNTTPGALELQQLFAKMVEAGAEYVVMEVSSHSIHQGRVDGIPFCGGIFTNITQDHLDYHGTFEEYLRVKTKFFADLPSTSWASINEDDEHAEYILSRTAAKVLTYGIRRDTDVKAENIRLTPQGAMYQAKTPQGMMELNLHLTGYFNVYNSLGVLTAALSLGIPLDIIKVGLERVTGVPGRFQQVTVPGADFSVIVDYAHTPDGLENILQTGRGLNPRRLIVVFGCGGDRDRTKRPIMGKIAAKLADYTIVTSDNPRNEAPNRIMEDIEAGIKEVQPPVPYTMIVDREEAIRKAIDMAEAGDLILIAGKGHENYQIFEGNRIIHFDDREIAKAALEERFHG